MAAGTIPRVALLSIHPEHAHAILDGRKRVEFRKRRFAPSVEIVLLYATSPTRKVVGYFQIAEQDLASPSCIWRRHGARGAVSRALFRGYFSDSAEAVAVLIQKAIALSAPLNLRDLGIDKAPQSFQYINARSIPLSAGVERR